MPDLRTRDLIEEISNVKLQQLFNTLWLNADDDSFGTDDVRKIKVSILLEKVNEDISSVEGTASLALALAQTVNTRSLENEASIEVINDKFITGSFVFGDVVGTTQKTVTIGQELPSANYKVFLQIIEPNASLQYYQPIIKNKTTTSFDIVMVEYANEGNNVNFDWMIVQA